MDNDSAARLKFALELSEPPTEKTRKMLHAYLDSLLDANCTEYAATFVINEGIGLETHG